MSPTLFFCCFSSSKNRNLQKKLPWMKVWEEKKWAIRMRWSCFFLYRFFDRFNKLSRYFFSRALWLTQPYWISSCILILFTMNGWNPNNETWNLVWAQKTFRRTTFYQTNGKKTWWTMNDFFRRDCNCCGLILITHPKKESRKNYKCMLIHRGDSWMSEKNVGRLWFPLYLFLACRFFQLQNGLHNSSPKKTSIFKEIYFIL